jgi:hypothetical protein
MVTSKLNEKSCDRCSHGRSLHRDQGSSRGSECFVEGCPCGEWSYNIMAEESRPWTDPNYNGKYDPSGRKLNRRREILDEAEELINSTRAHSYGPIDVSFGRLAALLNAMGWRRIDHMQGAVELTPADAALGMTQLKIGRMIADPKHYDNYPDAAGYIGISGELAVGNRETDSDMVSDDQESLMYVDNVNAFMAYAEPHPPIVTFTEVKRRRGDKERRVMCKSDGDIVTFDRMQAHMDALHPESKNYYSPPR